jgi:hypothetical protein
MLSGEILAGLTSIANDWRWLAITWHIVLASALVMLFAGWRPSTRLVGYLLVAPLISVSGVAWLSGNPFNGTTFVVLAAVLAWAASRYSAASVQLAALPWVALGAALVMFGWTYPHFLTVDSWATYLYASPFGLLPCPTLSMVIGVTLLAHNLRSPVWSTALAVAGVMYGAVGVFRLGVGLDWTLLFASAALGTIQMHSHIAWRSVRADRAERSRPLPGDGFIVTPLATLTHAITIGRPPHAVWPWLIQMGAGNRAGWYSYDVLDNGRKPSATRLIPELQKITIGTVFPALPGETEGFTVLAFDPCRSLILGWPTPGGEPLVTWSFVLERRADGATRLIARARGAQSYRFRALPRWLSKPLARFVHFLMQRKQLMGIAERVESSPGSEVAPRWLPERQSA